MVGPIEHEVHFDDVQEKKHGHSHGLAKVANDFSKPDMESGEMDPAVVAKVEENTREIKALAWLVLAGDGVHNFVDGMAIGAAMTQSLLAGFIVAIAVVCEELPHELGDLAILLNSGMSLKQAAGYNFLSACTCWAGAAVGVIVGQGSDAPFYILAIAGGMFLYISLVDIMPEINEGAAEMGGGVGKQLVVLFVQNLGLLSGFGIMMVVAFYGSSITLG